MFIFTEVDTETTGDAARAVGLVRGGEATGVAFLHFVQAHETLQTLRVLDSERLVADTLRFCALNELSKSWLLCDGRIQVSNVCARDSPQAAVSPWRQV